MLPRLAWKYGCLAWQESNLFNTKTSRIHFRCLEKNANESWNFSSLMTDGDLCHQYKDTEIAHQNLRLSKYTNMIIHWKGIEEHFLLVVPLVFRFNHDFGGRNEFSEFFSKILS
jgi:hypothetical protein